MKLDNYLSRLAKEVLFNTPGGLTKVRFAKILYFVHKGLVNKNLSSFDDLKFIRMPLGPVPVGFKDLVEDEDIQVTDVKKTPLSYDMQLYMLIRSGHYLNDNASEVVRSVVDNLKQLPTSYLVEEAHKDPSWINHVNGDEYFIGQDDLNLGLPSGRANTPQDPSEDAFRLQAKLVEGMLDEIVEENTSLEYPENHK
jgi:hypothetical protein